MRGCSFQAKQRINVGSRGTPVSPAAAESRKPFLSLFLRLRGNEFDSPGSASAMMTSLVKYTSTRLESCFIIKSQTESVLLFCTLLCPTFPYRIPLFHVWLSWAPQLFFLPPTLLRRCHCFREYSAFARVVSSSPLHPAARPYYFREDCGGCTSVCFDTSIRMMLTPVVDAYHRHRAAYLVQLLQRVKRAQIMQRRHIAD